MWVLDTGTLWGHNFLQSASKNYIIIEDTASTIHNDSDEIGEKANKPNEDKICG